MEVKQGYKLTEVGVIPEDWEVKRLENISKITSGKRLPSGYSLTTHVTDHPYIRVTDMNQTGINTNDLMYVPDNAYPHICRYRIFKSDLYISVAGTLGIVGKIPDILDGANLTENADRITDITCSQDYLLSVLSSPLIQDGVKSTQTVGAQPKLALIKIRNFLVPLPPLPEQTAIATALSDVDALISSLDALISKKKQIKQGAMQELLSGKRRLPGFSGEWEARLLNEISWFQEGPGVRNTQFTSSGIKLLNGSNIILGELKLDNTNRFISEKEAYGSYSHFMADSDDIVIASSGISIDRFHEKVARVKKNDLPLCMNTSTIRFKVNSKYTTAAFLFQLLVSDQFKRAIGGQATGSAQLNFGPSHLTKVAVNIPPLPEQQAIATILSDMDAEITTLEARRDKTKLLKQGMMQALLTGRIRLVPTILHAVSA